MSYIESNEQAYFRMKICIWELKTCGIIDDDLAHDLDLNNYGVHRDGTFKDGAISKKWHRENKNLGY